MGLRVSPEICQQRLHHLGLGQQRHALAPEAVEIRDVEIGRGDALASQPVELAQPALLVAPLGEGLFDAESRGEPGEDGIVVAGFAGRLDRPVRSRQHQVAIGADDVVALELGGDGQDDVGVAGGRRPPGLVHDDRLRPLPGAD